MITNRVEAGYDGPILFSDALRIVERVGKDLAKKADPSYHAYEYRDQSQYYKRLTDAARRCFNDVRRAHTKEEAIQAIKEARRIINTGIESNGLSRAIDVLNGHKFPQSNLDLWMAPKNPQNSRD